MMGKRQRDCVDCGAPVGLLNRQLCCRCVRRARERAAKARCLSCGQDRMLIAATGRCTLCSRCVECGHLVRGAEARLCKACRRKAELCVQQKPCPRCGKLGYLDRSPFRDLIGKPLWVAGIAAMVGGQLLGAAALGAGDVSLIEPLLTTNLLFALGFSRLLSGQALGAREWDGAVALIAGVVVC